MLGFHQLMVVAAITAVTAGSVAAQGDPSLRSWPKDDTPYVRGIVPEDYGPGLGARGSLPSASAVFIVDTVVSNTNPNLTNTDTANDGETSIAIDPSNPNQIVITAFSGSSGGNAILWHSTDGGLTWTQRATIPPPPGIGTFLGCSGPGVCDQAIDYGRANQLSGTFLDGNTNIFSGTTTNPASAASWGWFTIAGTAQQTNSVGNNNSDQPWLLVNRDPTTTAQDNVYVAYDDFNGGPDMRVAVATGTNPPNFVRDNQSGTSTGGVNPGHRLAKDSRTGFMYSLFQRCTSGCGSDGAKTIDYMLNRTTDGGQTWTLNGSGTGIIVATADSTQPRPKFGTVNALLGGVLHAAVDSRTGDLYYVYGNRDGGTGNDRLAIRRLQGNGSGGVNIGAENFVTGQVVAAIPSIAVASDGTVGVFYYTFDGFSIDNFPIFTARLALSRDQGVSFDDLRLLTFLSSATDNGNGRQRVLGDYMQMKTVGRTFYGSFTGNGAPFGRPVANHDPIFFKVSVGPIAQVNATTQFGDVCGGTSTTNRVEVFNTGFDDLQVTSISRVSGSADISVASSLSFPFVVSPDAHVDFDVRCAPSGIGPRTATIRVATSDPDRPQIDLDFTCNAPAPDIRVTGSAAFGDVCAETSSTHSVSVCNVGACNLNVNASLSGGCSDFSLVNNPFPAAVSHDACLDLTVRFTPTSGGAHSCNLLITSNDPDTPLTTLTLNGNTPAPSIDVPANVAFLPEVIQTAGVCTSSQPFPISNKGTCNLRITNVAVGGTDSGDFRVSGVPSFPIILEPGHIASEGALNAVFAPTVLDRDRLGTLSVTYVTDPISGATATISRDLCGEGVNTGARVLVRAGGVPVGNVEKLQLKRIGPNKNKNALDTLDNAQDLTLQSVTPAAPCAPFQFHREYGTVGNPIQLAAGAYEVTATAIVSGKRTTKTVGFDVGTCDFNPNIIVDF